MEYGLNCFSYQNFKDVSYDPSICNEIPVADGQTAHIDESASTGVRLANPVKDGGLLLRDDEKIETVCDVKKILEAPVTSGEKVGSIQYLVRNHAYRTVDLITTETIEKRDYKWCLNQTISLFLRAL